MYRCTAHRLAGPSRTAGAGQPGAPAARTSSSIASRPRSTAVIGSLMRMRVQFQRLRHSQQQQAITAVLVKRREATGVRTPPSPGSVAATEAVLAAVAGRASSTSSGGPASGGAASGSAAADAATVAMQTGVILCTEAQRLLNSEVRGDEPLSEVSPDSASFAVEAGKFLYCAAAFGATTTFVRVRRVLLWVGAHKEVLQTPRQVMSLCMPLVSLSDGPTAGVAFALAELYEPLLLSLQGVAAADASESSATTAEAAGESSSPLSVVQQHLVAITSAMSMVAKWAATRTGSSAQETTSTSSAAPTDATLIPATAAELEQMLRIAEASVAAMRRQVDSVERAGPDVSYEALQSISPADALQWLLALHGLERLYTSTSGVSADDTAAASRRITLCHRALLPLLRRVLDGTAVASTSGGGTSRGSGGASAAAAPLPGLRVHDALELLQLGLHSSVEPVHLDLVVAYALHALPNALASATMKDLSAAVQAVNKVRQRRPAAVSAPVLLALLASLRPALFLLRETHVRQLRAQDSSALVTALSRWEEVPGVTLSSDIVELLSQCFGEQLHVVAPPQLLPFVLTIARLEAAHAHPGDGTTTEPRYRFATTPRVLARCAQRATVLVAKDSTGAAASTPAQACMSATDAANLLTCFVQLSVPHCAAFFAAAEPLLTTVVRGEAAASMPAAAAIRQRVAVEDALRRFAVHATPAKNATAPVRSAGAATASSATPQAGRENDEEAGAVAVAAAARASALVGDTSRGLAALVQGADSPKALVMASALVRRRVQRGRKRGAAAQRRGEGEEPLADGDEVESGGVVPRRRVAARGRRLKDAKLAGVFAAEAERLAPRCSGVEAATLATTTAQLCSAGLCPPSAARGVLRALWARCGAALATESSAAAAPDEAAAPFVLTLSSGKALMDASRVVRFDEAAPPVAFLETLTALCAAASSSSSSDAARLGAAARGTAPAYAEAVAQLRAATGLGRSVVSYIAPLLRAAPTAESADAWQHTPAWRTAWTGLLRAYLDLVQAAMSTYAAEATLSETWWAETQNAAPPPVPFELLSMTAGVAAQVYRLVCQRGAAGTLGTEDSAEPAARPLDEDAELDADDEVDHAGGVASATTVDTAAVEATVRGVLGLLGDTIATLARQRQPLTSATATASPDLDEGDAAETHGLVQDPKHLLMLLQAFETVQCPHPEMLYSVLPELRGCADRLDPLSLSLLVRALNQLGAWNSRLLHVLAAAVEAKMDQCPLRQCYTLLRGLCRSGCASADTYVELRAAPRSDWSAGPGGHSSGSEASQAPLQCLTEAALRRLDALVRVEHDFMQLSLTASAADLVGVVSALQFFHAPPPATYDAFVVLAVHALSRPARGLPVREVLQHAVVLLGAVANLRQPAHQRVSAQALWAVIHRALASAASQVDTVLTLNTCWELTRYAAEHALRYGRAVVADFFHRPLSSPAPASGEEGSGGGAAAVAVQARLDRLLAERASSAETGPRVWCTAAEAAALRRYALHCAPSLARGDRDIVPYVCDPLRLAQLAARGDTGALLHTAAATAPAAQARRGVRLLACLLRSDVWSGPRSTPTTAAAAAAAANRRLAASAVQQLWAATALHALLARAPSAFSSEELLVLAAGARLVAREVPGAADFEESYAVAVRQLCASTTEWRVAAAVDAWVLFGLPLAAEAAAAVPQEATRADEDLFTMLATSGTVLVSTFAHAQRTWCSSSSARLLPELLRLFHGPGQLDVRLLRGPQAAAVATASPAEVAGGGAAARFAAAHDELLRCFAWCLESHSGTTTLSPASQ